MQYLGDSKDSFKWDYHDYLTNNLGYPCLNILLMMTPDDQSDNGKTSPSDFHSKVEIINFCKELREFRNLNLITELPNRTGSKYIVKLHKPNINITNKNRTSYFSNIAAEKDQVIFLDPDNGFQPDGKFNKKHVLYGEINCLLEKISDNSVISVFQHFRRRNFGEDFKKIRDRLLKYTPCFVAAIYWNFLMFVCLSKSKETIGKVVKINENYKKMEINKINVISD